MEKCIELLGYEMFYPNQVYGRKTTCATVENEGLELLECWRLFRYGVPDNSDEIFGLLQRTAREIISGEAKAHNPIPDYYQTPSNKAAEMLPEMLKSLPRKTLDELAREDSQWKDKIDGHLKGCRLIVPDAPSFVRMHYGFMHSDIVENLVKSKLPIEEFDNIFEHPELVVKGWGYQHCMEFKLESGKIAPTKEHIEECIRKNERSKLFTLENCMHAHEDPAAFIRHAYELISKQDLSLIQDRSGQSVATLAGGCYPLLLGRKSKRKRPEENLN